MPSSRITVQSPRPPQSILRFNRTLLIVLVAASFVTALLFRIKEWAEGTISSITEFMVSLGINTAISIVVTLSISWVILGLLDYLNKTLPWTDNLLKRLLTEFALTVPIAAVLGFAFGSLTHLINPDETTTYREFVFTFIMISVVMNIILVAISDWIYFFGRWKNSLIREQQVLIEKESIEREKVEAQYQALKNQVNPHFLFNCLNVLSSLVHESPDKAEEFIDEFASLYRYVLEHSDKSYVTLEQELKLAQSYLYLQNIRFGDTVRYHIRLEDADIMNKHLFPLSLQTVLENALKHNTGTPAAPIVIEIAADDQGLVVQNTLNRVSHSNASTGIGIQNLVNRYRPYNLVPRFEESDGYYLVYLPLFGIDHTQHVHSTKLELE